jgi:tight adherence protein C
MSPIVFIEVVACCCMGLALFVLSRTVTNTLHSDDLEQDLEWRYDVNRINELRKADTVYRIFQPLIHFLARFNRGAFRETLFEMHREIQAAGLPRYWTAAEYLAKLEVLGLLISPAIAYFCMGMMDAPGLVMAAVLTVLSVYLMRRQLAARAQYRLLLIKRRTPFMLDLLTLLMEAGATFVQALKQGVHEFRFHPVGQEFGRVLAEMNMGKSRTNALEALRDRLNDDEMTGIVGSIIQGEQLGTPLAKIFRTQAEVLRIKRVQRAETMAGEAGVKMLLPAILIMGATVLVILGPFLLSFINSELL